MADDGWCGSAHGRRCNFNSTLYPILPLWQYLTFMTMNKTVGSIHIQDVTLIGWLSRHSATPTQHTEALWSVTRLNAAKCCVCVINHFLLLDIWSGFQHKAINMSNQIKSNQIKFYLKSAMYIWKKRKISKKLFTRLYSLINNNKVNETKELENTMAVSIT